MTFIAHSYWRQIKKNHRTFESIKGEEVKDDVRSLAKADVKHGAITEEQYESYIGEAYSAE